MGLATLQSHECPHRQQIRLSLDSWSLGCAVRIFLMCLDYDDYDYPVKLYFRLPTRNPSPVPSVRNWPLDLRLADLYFVLGFVELRRHPDPDLLTALYAVFHLEIQVGGRA